jgi:pimeloyl-ACP methyl ester carboxylesterase
MHAPAPSRRGYVRRDGVRVYYEVYGDGEPTVFLLMPDVIVQSRAWKAQVPFLARSFRVVVIDPRGNGRSDTPSSPELYADRELVDDAWAVLDALGVEQAVLVGLCTGAGHAVLMAAESPDRVLGVCAINPGMGLTPPHPFKVAHDLDAVLDTDEGWAKLNRHYWRRDWPGFSRFFFGQMLPEPHSSKQWEDCVGWAAGTTVEAMLGEADAPAGPLHGVANATAVCQRVTCPVLVITGSDDRCQVPGRGHLVAELTGGDLVEIEGGGHLPHARDPVRVNLLLRDFVRRVSRHGGVR